MWCLKMLFLNIVEDILYLRTINRYINIHLNLTLIMKTNGRWLMSKLQDLYLTLHTKVIIFWLENGKFEFSRKQYIFLKHSKREFCAEFYYHF